MRLGKTNVPGKELTGLAPDTRRTDDEALNRTIGATEDRLKALEKTPGSLTLSQYMDARDIRKHTRAIQDTDSAALRTVRADDLLLSLEGGSGTLTLHLARNTARTGLLLISNNASAPWTIAVMDPGTEQVYRFTVAGNSFMLNPGDGVQMWNRTASRWELN